MAHFAQLDNDNVVLKVIVVDNDKIIDENGEEQESLGVPFCKKLYGNKTIWKQTSYNSTFRVRFSQVGGTYNEELDAFILPKPYDSWSLNEETADWVSPLGEPPFRYPTSEEIEDGKTRYVWDEELYQSDNTQGWVLSD